MYNAAEDIDFRGQRSISLAQHDQAAVRPREEGGAASRRNTIENPQASLQPPPRNQAKFFEVALLLSSGLLLLGWGSVLVWGAVTLFQWLMA